ncbi:chain length determinant protein [Streptomyces diastatochromogenes]|uniref:Chain length determinant protein n=1 Tax=Streptomyces diastatochromogenes TaxID=42236 RepID=A0A233SB08_STRDA|nr:chain length determinant protein [Streptomyces diastatochromogenes]MCZ0985313.1 chain length determinant protein [Streptomyces diastatochromogenes]OXY92812.1 chain length determinant protein [Streptomyces diastatochromogenes]
MDLAEIFRVMRRRWYVLLPGLLLTAGLIVGVTMLVPVNYQSQSTVVLLNSQKATLAYDGNPFLSTQTSLTGMADSLARNLNSDDSLRELKSRGAKGTFAAKLADNAQGPLMWLTVTGTDRASVLASDKILTAYAKERLDQFQQQQSVAPKAMIRMTTIVPPQNPVAQTKTRIEYLVMAGALGLVVTLVAAFYVEARKRPRKPEPAPETTAPVPSTPSTPSNVSTPSTGESVVEETLAIRRPPSWSRSAEDEDGPDAAEPTAPRPVMAGASATEPLDEESTHGHRPRTGQRDR